MKRAEMLGLGNPLQRGNPYNLNSHDHARFA